MDSTAMILKNSLAKNQMNQDEKLELQEHIYAFLKEKSLSTQKVYEGHLKEFFRFLSQIKINSVKLIKYSHLIAYKENLIHKDLKENSINIKLAVIKSFFKFLNRPSGNREKVYLQRNVAQYLKKQKVNQYDHSQTFDKDLFNKIIVDLDDDNVIELRDKCMITLFAYCGLRKNEVRQLQVNSIYIEENIPFYKVKGKGGKWLEKQLPQNIYSLIQKLIRIMNLAKKDFLFQNLSNHKGKLNQLSASAINYILNYYTQKYGYSKRFRVHSLRSMSGLEVYRATKDIMAVKNHLNHNNISTTQIYLQKLSDNKKVSYYDLMYQEKKVRLNPDDFI